MNSFNYPVFASSIFNNDQILFVPEGLQENPRFNSLRVIRNKEHDSFDFYNGKQIVFTVINPKIGINLMISKEFYIGWLDSEHGLISKKIFLNRDNLF